MSEKTFFVCPIFLTFYLRGRSTKTKSTKHKLNLRYTFKINVKVIYKWVIKSVFLIRLTLASREYKKTLYRPDIPNSILR